MINYSSWPRKKINTTSLRLDIDNPRLSENIRKLSQSEIIDYLVEQEKVFDLAYDIVTKGYFPNEQPIVVREKDKYHVLEGNRRVSALKILVNPDLIKSQSRKKTLKAALKNFDISFISKVEVIVAPDRESADILIVNRHTGGSAVEKWDKTKQDRFLHQRFISGESVDNMALKFTITKGEIKNSLKRYNVYQELKNLDLEENIKKAVGDETTFSITNVERLYQSKEGILFMGFEFNEDDFTLIKKLPQEEFNKRLEKIATDVVTDEINSRKLNNDADKKKYIDKLWDTNLYDKSIVPDVKYNNEFKQDKIVADPKDNSPISPKPTVSRKSKTSLMSGNIYLETRVARIDEIFNDLKLINLKKHPNAIAVLFRSYLDMLTYQFLKKKSALDDIKKESIDKFAADNQKKFNKIKSNLLGCGFDSSEISEKDLMKAFDINGGIDRKALVPSLKIMLSHIAYSETLVEDDKLKQALQAYLKSNNKLLGHNDFNLLVHNEYYTADPEELQKAWNQLYSLIDYFVIQIKS